MSDSVWSHSRQPTRLACTWDSPGKNAGVGCHFLLQCRKVKSEREVAQSCPSLRDPMDCSLPGSSVHGIFQARVLEWGAIAFSDLISSFCLYFELILYSSFIYFFLVFRRYFLLLLWLDCWSFYKRQFLSNLWELIILNNRIKMKIYIISWAL